MLLPQLFIVLAVTMHKLSQIIVSITSMPQILFLESGHCGCCASSFATQLAVIKFSHFHLHFYFFLHLFHTHFMYILLDVLHFGQQL